MSPTQITPAAAATSTATASASAAHQQTKMPMVHLRQKLLANVENVASALAAAATTTAANAADADDNATDADDNAKSSASQTENDDIYIVPINPNLQPHNTTLKRLFVPTTKSVTLPPGRQRLGITVKFEKDMGAVVTNIHSHCSFRSQITEGDVIVALNEKEVKSHEDFAPVLSGKYRGILTILPKEAVEMGVKLLFVPHGKMGVTVKLLQDNGAVITAIQNHCSFKQKIEIGDVITAVNGRRVTNLKDFHVAKRNQYGGGRMLTIVPKGVEERASYYVRKRVDVFLEGRGCLKESSVTIESKRTTRSCKTFSASTTATKESETSPPTKKQKQTHPTVTASSSEAASAAQNRKQRSQYLLQKREKAQKKKEEYTKKKDEQAALVLEKLESIRKSSTISGDDGGNSSEAASAEEERHRAFIDEQKRKEEMKQAEIHRACVKEQKRLEKQKQAQRSAVIAAAQAAIKAKQDAERAAAKAKRKHDKKVAKRKKLRDEFYEWHAKWIKYHKEELPAYFKMISGDGWEYRCEQLRQYQMQVHSNNKDATNDGGGGDAKNVPYDYKAPNDMKLGEWLAHQRTLYKEGKLHKERVEYLKKQGFDFEYVAPCPKTFTGDEGWDAKFLELIEYRKAHGNCDVPITYPAGEPLGQWIQSQRDQYFAGTLDIERHKCLRSKGFVFEPGTNVKKSIVNKFWLKNLEELKQFKRDYGHVEVPEDYKATSLSTRLAPWISLQRTLHRRKELSYHRIKLLQEVGLDVTVRKKTDKSRTWEKQFNKMLAYKELNGHCNVPAANGGLGGWVRRQRKQFNKNELDEDRLQRLIAIGFDFDPRNKDPEKHEKIAAISPPKEPDLSRFHSSDWTNNYEALQRFVEANGHADVNPEYNDDKIQGSLFTWIEAQKTFYQKNELPWRNIELLEELGVDLQETSNYDATRHDVRWETSLARLKLFYEKHGHCNVPDRYKGEDLRLDGSQSHLPWCEEGNLSKWLLRQRKMYRKGKLSEERRIKLENLGVDLEHNSNNKPVKRHRDMLGEMPEDDIWFDHESAGTTIKRRVPTTWKFPNVPIGEMYIFYHCRHSWAGEIISPLKLLESSDLSNKVDIVRLGELRRICTLIDKECLRKDLDISAEMTTKDANRCFRLGFPALNIPTKTPSGRERKIYELNWMTVADYERQNRLQTKYGPKLAAEKDAQNEEKDLNWV